MEFLNFDTIPWKKYHNIEGIKFRFLLDGKYNKGCVLFVKHNGI